MSILKPFITVISHPNNKGHFWRSLSITGWWKLNQLFFHLPAIVEIAPNIKIICYPNNSYGSFIVYAKWPEFEELKFIYSILDSNDTYVDVGAHIGDSSLLAASKIKTGKVIACEPTPNIYAELLANIRLNNFERKIIPLQKAVSDKVGTAFFSLEAASEVNHLLLSSKKGKSIKVPTTTIDSLVEKYSLKDITILKIDVEGFELEVLKGAIKSLRSKKIDMILFEVNPASQMIEKKLIEIEALLSKFSYEFYSFEESNLKPVSKIYIPPKTGNFLAILPKLKKTEAFKRWLK